MRKIVFFRWLLLALAMLATSAASFAQVGVAIVSLPRVAGLRPAALPRGGLYLDTWILGLGRRRLLLGAGNVGAGSGSRFPLDPGVLGLGRR